MKLVRDIYLDDQLLGTLVFQTADVNAHSRLSPSPNVESVMASAAQVFARGLKALPELQSADPARAQG